MTKREILVVLCKETKKIGNRSITIEYKTERKSPHAQLLNLLFDNFDELFPPEDPFSLPNINIYDDRILVARERKNMCMFEIYIADKKIEIQIPPEKYSADTRIEYQQILERIFPEYKVKDLFN